MAAVGEFFKNILPLLGADLEENTNTLQRKIDVLESRKDDVQEELRDGARLHRKKRKREVEDWLNNVEKIITEFETLKQKVLCSRFYTRQTLTEQVEIMAKEVTELFEQSDFPKGLFLEVDTSNYLHRSTDHGGIALLNHIWESIQDDNVVTIGLHGMGGIDKTTLAKHVFELLNKSKFSGHVYGFRVSQESSTYKLQSDIAHALNLDLSRENDKRIRATILSETFKERGRFVLILDGIWKQIDAEKIGIPLGMEGCKLIIRSPSKEVCQQMKCQRIIQVNKVSEQVDCELLLSQLTLSELSMCLIL